MGSSNSSSELSLSSSTPLVKLSSGIVEVISILLKNRMDEGWADTIREKLRKESYNNPDLEKQIYEKYKVSLDEFAVVLGDEELFKETFLLPHYRPDKILKEIGDELQQVKEFSDLGCPMAENEIKGVINRINDRKSKLSEYKFELILTECIASKINNILFKSS